MAITKYKSWDKLEEAFDWVRVMAFVPQDKRFHAEGSVAVHTQMVLQALEQLPAYRELNEQQQELLWAAALLHDVEKAGTTVTETDGSITSHGHARKGAGTARRILYLDVVTPFDIREAVVALVRYHGLPLWLLEKPDPVKTLIKASMEVNLQWLALLAKADVMGRICGDKAELLYRLDCFEEFCREHHCWGSSYPFASAHARMHYLRHTGVHQAYVPYERPNTIVYMMSGLPGAGKDSYVRKHFAQLPVISPDQIRQEMKVSATYTAGNGRVIQEAKERARELLRKHTSFVWNATNTTRQMREQLIDLFISYGAGVTIVYVEVPYQLLHKQNYSRNEVVPAKVIGKLAAKLEVPVAWEAHEVIWQV